MNRENRRMRRLGAGAATILIAAVLSLLAAERAGMFDRDCLLLVTLQDAGKLSEGSPVFYRGLRVGRVIGIRAPSGSTPGWRLRLAVDRTAFIHIATDARVRLEAGKPGDSWLVVVLPGLSPPDPDYPIDVKVLAEVSPEEDTARMAHDVLNGLADLSRAKRSEAEVIELREEIERLRRRLAEVEARPSPP